MNIYARIKIKQWILGEWPPHNFEEYVFIKSCIEKAYHDGLLSTFDIVCGLRYACGYEDRMHEERIQRFYTVMATLTGYTDYAFVRRMMPKSNAVERERRLTVMKHTPLWLNGEYKYYG